MPINMQTTWWAKSNGVTLIAFPPVYLLIIILLITLK